MNDLIERSTKYARSAGRTGEGQYRAAEKTERWAFRLSVLSAALTAIVGTTIFVQATKHDQPPWISFVLGTIALLTVALTAVERNAKLGDRAEAHRVAGSQYGRLRRRADMLTLKMKRGEVTAGEALQSLEKLGEDLSQTASDTRALPDHIYKPAAKEFDEKHPEYFAIPSHAGGVVYRDDHSATKFLVVRPEDVRDEWVLPKGHIEGVESAEQAARREVREEAGVDASVLDVLDTVEFSAPRGPVRARFFLMKYRCEAESGEKRELRWMTLDEAIAELSFKEAQRLVLQADIALRTVGSLR